MENKRPLIYLAAVVLVAAIVLILERPESPRVNDTGPGTFLPGFESAKVMRIEVSHLLDGALLKRDGNRWLVSEMATPLKKQLFEKEGRELPPEHWYRADNTRIAAALGGFGGLEKGLVVSTNPEKRSLYEVETTGLNVRLIDADEKPILDVVIGKKGPGLDSSYMRRTAEDTVYIVRRSLTEAFSPRAIDWRDRKVWVYDPKDLASIKVESPKGVWRISRNESNIWQVKEPAQRNVDETKAKEAASMLSDVRAEGFPAEPEKLSLSNPEITLSITDIKGKTFTLFIFKAMEGGRYPAKFEDVNEVYLLSKQFVEAIPLFVPGSKL